jgi:hypothetical protein
MESVTVECRGAAGVYLAYQLDKLPRCNQPSCMAIRARTDPSQKWVTYEAHNGSSTGFVRPSQQAKDKARSADALLAQMLSSSVVEFYNPGTLKPVSFPIGDDDRVELKSEAVACGLRPR